MSEESSLLLASCKCLDPTMAMVSKRNAMPARLVSNISYGCNWLSLPKGKGKTVMPQELLMEGMALAKAYRCNLQVLTA